MMNKRLALALLGLEKLFTKNNTILMKAYRKSFEDRIMGLTARFAEDDVIATMYKPDTAPGDGQR